MTEKILITGALGQIGTELTVRLSEFLMSELVPMLKKTILKNISNIQFLLT